MRLFTIMHQDPRGYPAGIEQYYMDLIGGPIGRTHECFLVYPDRASLYVHNHSGLAALARTYPATVPDRGERIRDSKTEESFAQAIQDYQPDLIHFQVLRNLPLGLLEIAQRTKIPTILTIHDYFIWCIQFTLLTPEFCHFETNCERCTICLRQHKFMINEDFVARRRAYVGQLLINCDCLVFPSKFVKDILNSYYNNLDSKRCVIIPNGLRIDTHIELSLSNQLDTPLRVAFLGNFLPHKGNIAFREIVRILQDHPALELHIFGHMYEPLEVNTERVKIHAGYNRRFIIEQLRQVGIDIVLLLSQTAETFSYTLSEAICAGAIIIASDIGALRDRVATEQVGFLVEHDNPVPRTCELLNTLANSRELVQWLKKRVAKAAANVPTYDQMTAAHLELYRKLTTKTSTLDTEII